MQKMTVGMTVLGLALMFSGCANATEDVVLAQPAALPPPLNADGEVVPVVAPGDEIAIACAPLEARKNSDVRVVLTISAAPNEAGLGYRKILATDEERVNGSVRVKIPSTPDILDHTVDLGVYVVDTSGSQYCEGGHLKIEAALKRPKGEKS